MTIPPISSETISTEYDDMCRSFQGDQPVVFTVFTALKPYIMARTRFTGVLIPPFEYLDSLPEGSLGKAYVTWAKERGVSRLVFGRRRHQLHDVFHLLTGFDNDPAGEQKLHAWFIGAKPQFTNFLVLFHWTMRCRALNKEALINAYRLGRSGRLDPDTFPVRGFWTRPLEEVRRELHLFISSPLGAPEQPRA